MWLASIACCSRLDHGHMPEPESKGGPKRARPHWIDKPPIAETEPMTEIDMTQPSPSEKQLDGRRTARQLSDEDRKTPEREDVNNVGKPFRLLIVVIRGV